MPSSHRRYRDWTHERIQRDAAKIGPQAAAFVDFILRSKPHPEQGFRSCVGIVRLVRRYPVERVEAACGRALALNTRSFTSVAAILKNKAEKPSHRPPNSPKCSSIRTFVALTTTTDKETCSC
jgi:transposase